MFANLCEIDGYQIADARLHLSGSPIRMARAAHEHTGFKNVMRQRLSPPYTAAGARALHASDLPSLLSARICHDLISPLGAIGNGVELLELAQTNAGPELALVRDSVQQAQARIRLFRIAFGPVRADQSIGADELRGILRDYTAHNRFRLDWTPREAHPKPLVKLAFLGLLCMETALPFGGDVLCDLSGGAVRILAHSDNPKVDPDLWAPLESGGAWPHSLRAAHVQFPLLREEVLQQGSDCSVNLTEGRLDLRITAGASLDPVN